MEDRRIIALVVGFIVLLLAAMGGPSLSMFATLAWQAIALFALGLIVGVCAWIALGPDPRLAWSIAASMTVSAVSIPVTLISSGMQGIATGLTAALNAAGGTLPAASSWLGLVPPALFVIPTCVVLVIRRRWWLALIPIAITVSMWYLATYHLGLLVGA